MINVLKNILFSNKKQTPQQAVREPLWPLRGPLPLLQLFVSKALQEQFEKDGFVVVDGPSEEEREALMEYFNKHCPPKGESSFDAYGNTQVMSVCGVRALSYLKGYRGLFSSLLMKRPGGDSTVSLHQDWNMVKKGEVSFSYWFPFQPLTPENGALYLMPGSHRLFADRISGVNLSKHSALRQYEDSFLKKYMVPLYLQPGQAVILDHGTVHGSPSNHSSQPRLAASVAMIPEHAQPIHYYGHIDGRIELLEVNDAFFAAVTEGGVSDIASLATKSLGFVEPPVAHYSVEQIEEYYKGRILE